MSEPDLPAWASPTAVVRALPFMAHLPAEVRNLILAGFEERTYRVRRDGIDAGGQRVRRRRRGRGARHRRRRRSHGGLARRARRRARRAVSGRSSRTTPPGVTLRAASSAVRVLRLDRGVAVALARAHPEAAAAFSRAGARQADRRVPAHGRDVQGPRPEGRRADRQPGSRDRGPRRRRRRAGR